MSSGTVNAGAPFDLVATATGNLAVTMVWALSIGVLMLFMGIKVPVHAPCTARMAIRNQKLGLKAPNTLVIASNTMVHMKQVRVP